MEQEQQEREFNTHILICETPASMGRTVVPVRISKEWTVITGYASPAAVWGLFGAAAQWTSHVRQHGERESDEAGRLREQLVRAVTGWQRSARDRNQRGWDREPKKHSEEREVPRRIASLNQYVSELTGRASRLAWDIQEGRDASKSTENLLRTAESYRRPASPAEEQERASRRSRERKPKSEETRKQVLLDSVKQELTAICLPLGERLRDNIQSTGGRNLLEETTNRLLRSTLQEMRGWYDRYQEAVNALDDPQKLQQELNTLNRDISDQLMRPTARLRTLAANIEQRRRNLKKGDPQELLRSFLDATVAVAGNGETGEK